MENKESKTEALLHAYIDGRLEGRMRAKVRRYMQQNPERSIEFGGYNTIDLKLKTLFNSAQSDIVPERFLDMVYDYQDGSPHLKESRWQNISHRFHFPQLTIYASIVMLTLSFGFIYGYFTPNQSGNIAAQPMIKLQQLVIDAHNIYAAQKRHAVEVTAKEKDHLMKWLSGTLGTQVPPIDLKEFEYTLMGGRLLPSLGKNAALYMYTDKNDARLTLYIRSNEQIESSPDIRCGQANGDTPVCTWRGKKLIYFLVGSTPKNVHELIAQSAAQKLVQ